MAPSSGGRKRKRKPKPTQHKPEHQQTAHSSLREATLSRITITTRGSSSSRSHRTAQGAAGVVAKQEAQQAVAEPAGPATKAAKRARRATTTTASVVASLEIVKNEEHEGEELGEAAATSPMRAPRAAKAAAAAAAATVVTPFDFLPTLAPAGLFVGCSGCIYKHWHATPAQPHNFYPFPSAAREFAHYAAHFNSLEINHTFYHLPSPETCARWRAQAPRPEFLYVLKAHRYFTHTKRIHVDEWFRRKWEEAFWPRCQELGPHLGPVLFQFPKGFQRNPTTLQRLDDLGGYLASQCPGGRFAIEFRHPSWFDEQGRREAYPLLRRHNLCLCGIHVANPAADPDPDDAEEEEDGTWGALRTGCHPPLSAYPHDGCEWGVYLRFHGNHSRGSYGAQALEAWAAAVWRWRREGLPPNGAASPRRQAFAFFNNDASMDDQGEPGLPSAVADAHRLGQLLVRRLEAERVATADDADGMGAGKGEGEGGIVVKGEQPS